MKSTKNSLGKIVLICLMFTSLYSAGARQPRFKITASGLEYRILKNGKGEAIKKSHRVFLRYTTRINSDTALFDESGNDKPFSFIVGEKEGLMGWDEGLLLLHVGDSAEFIIPPSLAYGSRKVGRIPANASIRFNVYVVKQEQAYFDLDGKLCVQLDTGLLKYQITAGNGAKAEAFCELTMAFTGYIKDANGGKRIFQSSQTNSNKAIFQLGAGRMVKGLEIGLATMRIGEKSTFVISPQLAFGDEKNGIIPANSTLYFDIELLDCKNPFFQITHTDTVFGKNGIRLLKLKDSAGTFLSSDKVAKIHVVTYFIDSLNQRIVLSSTRDSNLPLSVRSGARVKLMGLNYCLEYLKNGDKASVFLPASSALNTAVADTKWKFLCHDIEVLDVNNYPFFDTSKRDTTAAAAGLKYITVRDGKGEPIKDSSLVTFAYTGYVLDAGGNKMIFDASRENGRMLNFTMGNNEVIKGFEMGVIGMREGEARHLIIPPDIGYGTKGIPSAGIPENAILYFDVELIQIEKNNQTISNIIEK